MNGPVNLRVVKGAVDEEELAALVAVFARLATTCADGSASQAQRVDRARWRRLHRGPHAVDFCPPQSWRVARP